MAGPETTTSFSPGNSINLVIRTQNTFNSDVTAYFTWKVTDPLGRVLTTMSWEGNLTTPGGTIDWYLPASISTYAISGDYLFEGSIAYSGQTTTQSTVFSVLGPETVESVSAYIVAGAAGATLAQSELSPSSDIAESPGHSLETVSVDFNAGDPIELHMLVYNNATTNLIVHMMWMVIDPQGRIIEELSYEGDLETGPGLWDWRLANNIPPNAFTGDYYFLGEVTYAERPTQVSSTFYVQGNVPDAFDDINSPYLINTLPYSEWSDVWNTTFSLQDPILSCAGLPNSNSVWYQFTSPYTGRVSVDTQDSWYDTVVGVFSGTASDLTEIACNDDFYGSARTSRLEFQATSGVSYYIAVMDWNNPGGGWLHLQLNSVQRQFLPVIGR